MQGRRALLLLFLLLGTFLQVNAANFTFTFGSSTQCNDFPVSWSGGTAPFTLTLAPEFGTQRTLNVPASNFTNGKGSFSTQLPFVKGQRFLAIMSDASGFASGGVSSLITTGAGSTGCNTTDTGVDFFFELNDALVQCREYNISGYDLAIQPVTIFGVVPGGSTFVLNPPNGPSYYDWLTDVAAGTSLMFIMTDSKGRSGGCSDVRTVSLSDDKTCVNKNSPASITNAPHATKAASTTSSRTSSTHSAAASNTGTNNTGAIVGGVLAGLFGLFSLTALGIFFWKRRGRSSRDNFVSGGFFSRGSRRKGRLNSMDLDPPVGLHDGSGPIPVVQPFPYTSSAAGDPFASPSSHNLLTSRAQSHYPLDTQTQYSAFTNPFSNEPPPLSEYSMHSRDPSLPGLSASGSSVNEPGRITSMSSSGRSKALLAGAVNTRPTRFILHTDIEEAVPEDENEEVVELPPQYSERRAPLPSLQEGSERSSTAPSNLYYLEHRRGDSDIGLQPPIQPGPITPPPGSTFNYPRS
ncbi:hypothetical protein BDY19DRAFT_44567 [Irpex rosettiformis]|uniref:Uncharacterized protein n=1 Tax=Irpex rosettiformis TaxID=378272 RepID=A0ACB8UKK6_9APHY|nr:hypothetical protein BDY19DRAFT_44567 [Irpex rosettiformis]